MSKEKQNNYNYKGHQLVQVSFPANGEANLPLNSIVPIDKIRISVFDNLAMQDYTPLILVSSNFVSELCGGDPIIGTVGCDYVPGTDYDFASQLAPKNGATYFFTYKLSLFGTYKVYFRHIDGSIPQNITNDAFVLVEYFASE